MSTMNPPVDGNQARLDALAALTTDVPAVTAFEQAAVVQVPGVTEPQTETVENAPVVVPVSEGLDVPVSPPMPDRLERVESALANLTEILTKAAQPPAPVAPDAQTVAEQRAALKADLAQQALLGDADALAQFVSLAAQDSTEQIVRPLMEQQDREKAEWRAEAEFDKAHGTELTPPMKDAMTAWYQSSAQSADGQTDYLKLAAQQSIDALYRQGRVRDAMETLWAMWPGRTAPVASADKARAVLLGGGSERDQPPLTEGTTPPARNADVREIVAQRPHDRVAIAKAIGL